MHRLELTGKSSLQSLLCLGAHSDDLEIGCGGTILRLIDEHPGLHVHWVVFSGDDRRQQEARTSAGRFLQQVTQTEIEIHQFRDGFLPYVGGEVKEKFELLKKKISPDLILTHYREDLHQDHRLVNELTWNTFRDHLIWEYEVPKYDGDLGRPNLFVPLDDTMVSAKLQILNDCFGSQRSKRWFTDETFLGLLRLRGIECGSRYAEAFYGRKITI